MTRFTLDSAAVGTGPAAALPPTSVDFGTGEIRVVTALGGQQPTVLSLVAAGRMAPTSGRVAPENRRLALIDTPSVAEHPAELGVASVIREELAWLPRRDRRGGVRKVLARHDIAGYRKLPFSALSAQTRMELLVELALARPDVDGVVVTSPERHGGATIGWWRTLSEAAARGAAVLVVTDSATAETLERMPLPAPEITDLPLFDLS
jgi:hypothetical protein